MKIGVIADDFTGASDIALTLAEGGLRTAQFNGIPDKAWDGEAAVVALKIRTVPVADAIAQAMAACDWLVAQGARQIIYKVCSTFDSTDDGNIGQVTAALAERLNARHVLVCPAFPANGRSVYMGHLFVQDRLLNESGMQDHPLTPMTDPDLRRVLARQTDWTVGHIAHSTISKGAATILGSLPDEPAMIIVDAIDDHDLMTIGEAAKGLPLLTGGSGIALGLPANFGATPAEPPWQGVAGPGAVLAGSCSRATRAQVARYRQIAPATEITADGVMDGSISAESLASWALAQKTAPLIYSSTDPAQVAAAQARYGSASVATAIEDLFGALASILLSRGVSRLVVAGGETSGAVVTALALDQLDIGPRLANGVPALHHQGRAFALKSGNFGDEDFFATALARLEKST